MVAPSVSNSPRCLTTPSPVKQPPATTLISGKRIVLVGEVDLDARSEVVDAVTQVGPGAVIDLAAVTFIDVAGLGALLRSGVASPGARIINACPQVRHVIDLAGLSDLIDPGDWSGL